MHGVAETEAGEPVLLESVACYFCGAEEGRVWGEEGGYQALKCSGCGLVYVSPRPRKEFIDEAARTGEHQTERGPLAVTGRFRHGRVRRAARLVREVFPNLADQAPARWLDIGAGFGELVSAVKKISPTTDVLGIEPNEAKRKEASRQGIRLAATPLSDLPEETFSVVSLMNVWSHLPDPERFMERIRALLTRNGHVLIETGNGGELTSAAEYPDALLLPDHLSFAGERHVVGVLERAGFRVEAVHRRRVDTVRFAAHRAAKRLLGKPGKLVIPYRSDFRTLWIRAGRR